MKIVKSFDQRSTFQSLALIEVNPDDATGIRNCYLKPFIRNELRNTLATNIPLTDDATARKNDQLDFSGCIQPIVFEFDHDTLEHQRERAKHTAKELQVTIYLVNTGNESYQMIIFCDHFANTPTEYRTKCFELLKFLNKKLPYYYQCSNPNTPNDPNRPDTSMFSANKYFRQPNGYRTDTRKEQTMIEIPETHEYFDMNRITEQNKSNNLSDDDIVNEILGIGANSDSSNRMDSDASQNINNATEIKTTLENSCNSEDDEIISSFFGSNNDNINKEPQQNENTETPHVPSVEEILGILEEDKNDKTDKSLYDDNTESSDGVFEITGIFDAKDEIGPYLDSLTEKFQNTENQQSQSSSDERRVNSSF